MKEPNSFDVKTRRYGLVRFLLDLEYKAFGYLRAGGTTEVVDDGVKIERDADGYVTGAHSRSHIVRYAFYKRHRAYPTNFLFSSVAFVDRILSSVRVILGTLLIPAAIICALAEAPEIITIYAVVYGANIVTMILGFIIRKSFRLDEQMDKICDDNGWKRYSEYYEE